MKTYETLADALNDLKNRGYECDFQLQSDCLYCSDLDMRLYEEEFNVDEVYRFEGDSDPEDTIVVYALTSPTGVKGTIVDDCKVSTANSSLEIKWMLKIT